MPFDWARPAISFWRSTVSAAIPSSSQSRVSRTRSELSSSSSCLISGENSKQPAIANDSSGTSAGGASISAAVSSTSRAKSVERPLDVLRLGGVVLVVDRLDASGHERAALGQLDQPEPLASFDDDVEPAVGEALDDLGDRRERPDLAQPVVVGVDDAERHALLEALADQLAVARLEDVQRHLLGGEQHEAERKQADLFHARQTTRATAQAPPRSLAQPKPCDTTLSRGGGWRRR